MWGGNPVCNFLFETLAYHVASAHVFIDWLSKHYSIIRTLFSLKMVALVLALLLLCVSEIISQCSPSSGKPLSCF